MGPLAAVERFLERLFERQSARLFRTAIRPVQVQRRLERAMEGERTRDGSRTIVPHRFVVHLHPDDLAALGSTSPGLAATLADGALAFARSHAYTLLDRPVVALRSDPSVATGDIQVEALDPREADQDRSVNGGRDQTAPTGDRSIDAGPAPNSLAPVVGPAESRSGETVGPAGDQTAVFVVPGVDGPHATIREIRPDRSSRSIAFDGHPLTIGRAPDNAIVLRDGRASRHHARIDSRRGALVLTDLGSTNGSFVNDRQVDSIALGEGDRIRVGTSVLLIESIDATPPPNGIAAGHGPRDVGTIDEAADGAVVG